MILRRRYLWLALAALSKADDNQNLNLVVPDQDDEAALLDTDDWKDHHPDWMNEVEFNQQ